MDNEQINNSRLILHLKYIVVIFILVCSTVGGMALFNQDFAIKSLSAASLLTSIVLAVVAILITLWDVAGQKSNILTLQETLKSFKGITEKFQSISEENEVSLKELKEIIIELNENVMSYESKFAQIESKIEASGNDTLMKELEEIKSQNNISTLAVERERIKYSDILVLEKSLKEKFSAVDIISHKILLNFITTTLGCTTTYARKIISYLVKNNVLNTRVDTLTQSNGEQQFEMKYFLQ